MGHFINMQAENRGADDVCGNHVKTADEYFKGLDTLIGKLERGIMPVDGTFDSFDEGNIGLNIRQYIDELAVKVIVMVDTPVRMAGESPLVLSLTAGTG